MSFREMVFKLYKGAEVDQSRAIFWVNQHGRSFVFEGFWVDFCPRLSCSSVASNMLHSFGHLVQLYAALNLTRLDDAAIVWPGLGK